MKKLPIKKCHHQYTICITIFRYSTIIRPWLLKTFVAYVNNQLHVLKPLSIILLKLFIFGSLRFYKIVVFDNKINHPGKRHKKKHSWLDFVGFLIGKMTIYAECKKIAVFVSDDFLWANKKCIWTIYFHLCIILMTNKKIYTKNLT